MASFHRFANVVNIRATKPELNLLDGKFKQVHHNPQVSFEVDQDLFHSDEVWDWMVKLGIDKDNIGRDLNRELFTSETIIAIFVQEVADESYYVKIEDNKSHLYKGEDHIIELKEDTKECVYKAIVENEEIVVNWP